MFDSIILLGNLGLNHRQIIRPFLGVSRLLRTGVPGSEGNNLFEDFVGQRDEAAHLAIEADRDIRPDGEPDVVQHLAGIEFEHEKAVHPPRDLL